MSYRAVGYILPLCNLERFSIWQTLISLSQVAAATPLARSLIRASLGRSLKRSQYNQPALRYASSTTVSAFDTNLQGPPLPYITSEKKVTTPQTLTEKILQRYSVDLPKGKVVRSGDFVQIQPHRCLTHDNTWPVAMRFMSTGATKIKDPAQLVFALDHDIQNTSPSNLKKYHQIQEFAKKHGVNFFGAGHGIGHQIMVSSSASNPYPGPLVC